MGVIERQEMELITEVQDRALQGIGWGAGTPQEEDGGMVPWIYPPKGYLSFDEQGVAALGLVGTTVNILVFQVPQGYDGVIKKISHNTSFGGFINGSGDLAWRINIGGVMVKNYGNMLSEMGSQQIPREIAGIRVFAGQPIIYQVNHVANVALAGNVVCSLGGWFYPRKGQ